MNTRWLGYCVDSSAGRVGTVAGIVSGGDGMSPLVVVRLGREGRRVGLFPLKDIGQVDTLRRVVVLSRVELQADPVPLAGAR